ncbi:MAG: YodC family protein [Phreatobacter sp.]|uniref:YodC family protein n=1 Tax=Phreatobacter sp. TaxID=1966341 RepID=UPI0040352778
MTFTPGDIVTLKSGGQPLTVTAIGDDEATCIWLGEEGDLFREAIPLVALQAPDLEDEEGEDDEDGDDGEKDEEEAAA